MIKKTIPIITGGTTGATGSFNFNISLVARSIDLGFFDTYTGATNSPLSGYTGTTLITGTSSSRLYEIRKYTVSGTLSDLYFTSTGATADGLNVSLSSTGVTASTYVYYLGGIIYTDQLSGTGITTTFIYISTGLSFTNFENKPIIKIESKENLVDNPFINSDVFIIRQELPVFEKSIRLRSVSTLNDVLTYAGGNYFKVFNNT